MWKSEDNGIVSTSSQLHHHHHHHPVHHMHPSTMSQMSIIGSSNHSSSDSTPGHSVGRKKRRGMIEKRRRDRINNSLNELRRLVPAAFEKQGSAKLEKAEILQMTVDHLTMLHAKGFDAFSFDPHKFAMDYHAIGFRECASEVARYMVTIEGLDLQDPLRLRLMAHLQCYAAQREMSLKASSASSSWNPSAFTTPSHTMSSNAAAAMSASSMPPPPPPPALDHSHHHSHPDHHSWTSTIGHGYHPSQSGINGSDTTATSVSGVSTVPSSMTTTTLSNGQSYFTYPGSSVKHYRPWGGTELAY